MNQSGLRFAGGGSLEHFGFTAMKNDRNLAGKEKKVDLAIAHKMTNDAYPGVAKRGEDEMTLITGDSDYAPVPTDPKREGLSAREVKEAGTKFVSLDPFFGHLTRCR